VSTKLQPRGELVDGSIQIATVAENRMNCFCTKTTLAKGRPVSCPDCLNVTETSTSQWFILLGVGKKDSMSLGCPRSICLEYYMQGVF
jgi:hypothetical protein